MQQRSRDMFLNILVVLLLLKITLSENNIKLKDVLRNSSKTANKTSSNYNSDEENVFKSEALKLLGQCGEKSEKDSDDNTKNDQPSNRNDQSSEAYYNKNKDLHNTFGYNNGENQRRNGNLNNNRDYTRNSRDNYSSNKRQNGNIDPYSNGYDNNNNDYNNGYDSNRRGNSNNDMVNTNCNGANDQSRNNNRFNVGYDANRPGNTIWNRNCNDNNNPYGNNGNSKNTEPSRAGDRSTNGNTDYFNMAQNNNDRTEGYSSDSYYGYGSNREANSNSYGRRLKRSNNKREYDNQCTSQCVLGYMQLLDDEQVPSETMILKWVQDHIAHDDMNRIKTLREVRSCFARLSTSDIEEGCEFSKEFTKCMDLEVE